MVSVRGGLLFLLVLGVGCVVLLWHTLSLPYNYFGVRDSVMFHLMFVNYTLSSVWVGFNNIYFDINKHGYNLQW